MKRELLEQVRAERAHLRRQCMVGYAIFNPETPWNGELYHRLHRAKEDLASAPRGSEVVLVHTTGALFYQSCGDSIGRVITAGGKTHHLPVQRGQRGERKALKRQARQQHENLVRATAQGHRPPGRGFQHQAFLD